MRDYTKKGPCPKPETRPRKQPQRIAPISEKGKGAMKENQAYYARVIAAKAVVNKETGFIEWHCENCGDEIVRPTGRNVSHILGKGSNPALYLDPDNNFLLCRDCEHQWTDGDKTKMRIYPRSQEISSQLTNKHYTKKSQ